MIVRINGREEPKHDSQVRLSEAMLHLGGGVRLGRALLRLGRPENAEIRASGLPRHRGVEQNAELARFDPFHRKFPSKPKLKINHNTHLILTNNISNRIFPTQLRQKEIYGSSIQVIQT